MIQLHRSYYTTDRVAEILAGSAHELNLLRLQDYLRRANLTTQRIFGFLFDRLGLAFDPTWRCARVAAWHRAASPPAALPTIPSGASTTTASIVDRYASA